MINNSLIKFLFILTIIVSVFLIGNSTLASTEKVPNFSEQIEFRKEFGLEANHTKVELLNLEGKLLQNSKFQVPLTIEEEEELEKRFALQNEEVPKVKKFLDDKYTNKNFSMYIDQANKGEVIVKIKKLNDEELTTEQKESILNELNNVSTKIKFKVEDSSYSEDDLNKISEQIWEKKNSLDLEIDSTSVDIINEKITVGIINYTLEKVREIEAAFESYPLEIIEVSPPDNHRSAYGGEKIVNSRGGSCSAGYYATSGSSYYLITAGHCSRTYDSSTTKETYYYSDTYTYGTTYLGKVSSIRYGGSLDALSISVSSSNANSIVNINGGLRKMTSSQARNGDTVGQSVCRGLGMQVVNHSVEHLRVKM